MPSFDTRRSLLRAGLAAGTLLALPSARGCEFFSTNLRVIHPWTRASAEGDRSALLCMKFDDVAQPDRLIGVETPVCEGAEMGGPDAGPRVDFPIPAARASELSEAGPHVRLIGLRWPLQAGREYPLRLTFERGGVVAATLNIDYVRFK